MARVTVEDCLEKVPNRFALVLMVSKRAKQLLRGSESTVPGKNNKYIVQSLREVAAGNIGYETALNMKLAIEAIERDLKKDV